MTDHEGSSFVRHIDCNQCGSSDANSEYSDGHTFCFSCGAYTQGDGQPTRRKTIAGNLLSTDIEYKALVSRKLTEETCRKFGYGVVEDFGGTSAQVAPYYDAEGNVVAQKIRQPGKKFTVLGSLEKALPFGAQCWPRTGKMIVVTEGEIDALSMSQVQGNKWPVVSIPNGAQGAKKFFATQRDYFREFEKVVIMFDNDEPGRKAAEEAARVLGIRAAIATFPEGCKDPNDMLVNGRTEELVQAMWKAKEYRPDGIIALEDLKDSVREKPSMGLSWPWPRLTELTYGIQRPYIYTIGAAVGGGKTDVLKEIIKHLVIEHGESVGAFLLEEEPSVTAVELASKVAGKLLHTPEGWNDEAFERSWTQLIQGPGKVRLYENFGMNDWNTIREQIEYLHHAEGIRYFILDHLTALVADAEDERRELDRVMADLSGLVVKLGSTAIVVSHLTTPQGTSHEEGGRVEIKHMTGSRAIARWTFGAFGLERNQQHENVEMRHTTTLRILKLRRFGWLTGECMWLKYDKSTGLLHETDEPKDMKSFGFDDEDTEVHTAGNNTSKDF